MSGCDREVISNAVRVFQVRLIGPGGPFELELLPSGIHRFKTGASTLGQVYQRASRMSDRPLIVTEGEQCSYSEIFQRALAIAARLKHDGRAGQRIGLLLEDGPEWVIWFVAITAAGACCVLPPPGASTDVIVTCLESAACRTIVSKTAGEPIGAAENIYEFGADRAVDGQFELPQDPDAEAMIAFTSGSSGRPKGVIHTHRSLLTGLRNMMLGGALASRMKGATPVEPGRPQPPSTLILAPLAYIAGYSALLLGMIGGGRIVLAPAAAMEEGIAQLVQDQSVQSIAGASADLVRRLIRLPAAATQLASLRRLQLHGERLQSGLVDEVEGLLPQLQVMTGYGLTETAGSIAASPASCVLEMRGGCGLLLPSAEVRAVGAGDQPLPTGELGQVQVRGDMLMRGYLDPARNSGAFTEDGWFVTGDMGSVDAFGWLTILDRADSALPGAIPVQGFGAAVEEAIRALPGVDDAALTLPADDDRLFVFLQMVEDGSVDFAHVASTLRSLGQWNGPVEIRPVDRLPRTASGKVDRVNLLTRCQ